MMPFLLILSLQALTTAVLVYPDNEANDVETLSHPGDLTDFVVHTEADAHEAEAGYKEIGSLRNEDDKLEEGLLTTERQHKMMQNSERLEIAAQNAQMANFKRKLVQIASGYKKHLWKLNDELHACAKSHEKISEQLGYSRSKLASVHGLIDQEASKEGAIKNRYGGLAQDLRKAHDTDSQRIGILLKDVNQSAVKLRSAQHKLNTEKANAMNMSEMVNASASELLSMLTANKKNRIKLSDLENATAQVNSSMLKVGSNYRKWSRSLEAEQQQFKKKTNVIAAVAIAGAAEVKRLVQEAASLGSDLTAAEIKRKNMQEEVDKAQQLLAKDAELISRFEIKSQQFKSEAALSCKQQNAKILGDLDQTAEVLEAKLERARAGQQELQAENRRLKDEINALRLKANAPRLKAAAAGARVEQAEAEVRAQAAAEEARAKQEAALKAKAAAQQARAKANQQATLDDQDKVVDQELSDDLSSTEEASQAQEEVDRAWAAEQRRKNQADAEAAVLSKEGVPKSISAHEVPHAGIHQNDHESRVDDVDREVAEELQSRHSQHVSQEFTKMTMDSMEASKSNKASKVSSWNEFVKGAKFKKFLDMSDEY